MLFVRVRLVALRQDRFRAHCIAVKPQNQRLFLLLAFWYIFTLHPAALPRSDAFRLTEFIAIPTLLWHIRQLLFWFLSVQLRSDVQRLLLTCRALMLFG